MRISPPARPAQRCHRPPNCRPSSPARADTLSMTCPDSRDSSHLSPRAGNMHSRSRHSMNLRPDRILSRSRHSVGPAACAGILTRSRTHFITDRSTLPLTCFIAEHDTWFHTRFFTDRDAHRCLGKTAKLYPSRHLTQYLKITAYGHNSASQQSSGDFPNQIRILHRAVHASCPVIKREHAVYVRRGRYHSLPAGDGGET